MKLSDRYMLVVINAKHPKATRSDAKAKAAVERDVIAKGGSAAVAHDVAKAQIELYPKGSINSVMTNYHAFNAYHGAVTVEYIGGKGAPRLLSIHKQRDHSDRFHTAKLAFEQAKTQWLKEYSATLEKLQLELGEYFQAEDYPSAGNIAHHWQFDCQYMPIADPTAFELGQFAEDQRQDLERQMAKAMERAAEKATKQYIARLREQLGHVSDQLRHGKRLHGSLLTNLQDLLGAELNVTARPELDAVLTGTSDAANSVAAALETKEQIDRDMAARKIESIDRKLAGIF